MSSRAELAQFLDSTDDLIGLRADASEIIATGRKYQARPYGRLTPEHVATLWQGQVEMQAAERRGNTEYNNLVDGLVDEKLGSMGGFSLEQLRALRSSAVTAEDSALVKQFQDLDNELHKQFDEGVKAIQKERGDCAAVTAVAHLSVQADLTADQKEFLNLWRKVEAYENSGSAHEKSLRRGGLGFSLDPVYMKPQLTEELKRLLSGDTTDFVARLELQLAANVDRQGQTAAKPAAELAKLLVELLRPYEKPILDSVETDDDLTLISCLLSTAIPEDDDTAEIARAVRGALLEPVSYQTARYDGGIEGTEAGLVLFYTDLLAKLYGQDFAGVTTKTYGSSVPEWLPSAYDFDPTYIEETRRLPGTRIWFGLRSDGSRVGNDRSISFPRTAVRVFALSNSGLGDKKEVQPSFLNEVWVGYFNEHYDRIAAFETKYDQLNQLTKWSLALDVLNSSVDNSSLQQILREEQVRRNLWLPTWLKTAVVGGDKLPWLSCFRDASRPGDDAVETTQIFHAGWPTAPDYWCDGETAWSAAWGLRAWSIQGGVSLPGVGALKNRLTAEAAEFSAEDAGIWRPQLSTDNFSKRSNGFAGKFVPESGYGKSFDVDFADARRQSTITMKGVSEVTEKGDAAPDVLMRGRGEQVRSSTLVEKISLTGERTATVEMSDGQTALGRVEIAAGSDGFRIEVNSGGREIAKGLALSLSRQSDANWAQSLAADLRVDSVIAVEKRTFARLKSGDWYEFSQETKQNGWNNTVWQARASGDYFGPMVGSPSKVVMSRQVDEAALNEALRPYPSIEFVRVPRDDASMSIMVRGPPNEPPPPDSIGLAFGPPEEPFRGYFNSDGSGQILNSRPIPLGDIVTALKGFDNKRLDAAKLGDVIQLTAPAPSTSAEARTLVGKMYAAADQADARGLRAALESVKDIRANFDAAIVKAEAIGDKVAATALRDERSAVIKLTQKETLDGVKAALAREGMARDDAAVAIFSQNLSPSDLRSELVKRAAAAAQRGPDALKDEVQQAHFAFAEASQQQNNAKLVVTKGSKPPFISVKIDSALRVGKATPEQFANSRLVYMDDQLRQANLADPVVLRDVMKDAHAIEIVHVTLAKSPVPKPDFAPDGAWQDAYAAFIGHVSMSYSCAPQMPTLNPSCFAGMGGPVGGNNNGGNNNGGGSGANNAGGSGAATTNQYTSPSSVLILVSGAANCDVCQSCPRTAEAEGTAGPEKK